jgi:hypothetical protein
MGDALSGDVSLRYLGKGIIEKSKECFKHSFVTGNAMPSFRNPDIPSLALAVQASGPHSGIWPLAEPLGIAGPGNLVAMTMVTSPAGLGRIAELRKVPSRFKGLSCEPLFAPLAPGPVRH